MTARGRPRGFDKEDALRRAMEVFWTRGYDGASMAELTRAMGLSPPSLYAAFGGKADLFRAAVDLYLHSEGAGIWTGLDAAATAREAAAHVLYESADAFTGGPCSRGCMIVLAAPQSESPHPEICEELKQHRVGNVDLLERRFERGVAEGDLPPDADCRALANFVATVQHGMSIQARDGAARETLRAVADCTMAGWDRLAGTG